MGPFSKATKAIQQNDIPTLLSILNDHPEFLLPSPLANTILTEDAVIRENGEIDDPKELLPMLHHLAYYNRVEMIDQVCLQNSSSVDIPNKYGYYPIHVAAEFGKMETILALARNGTQRINFESPIERVAPIHYAIMARNSDNVRALTILGAIASQEDYWFQIRPDQSWDWYQEILNSIDEKMILEIRFAVHFSRSLVWKLLLEL